MLQDKKAIIQVLGAIYIDPKLLQHKDYDLKLIDFPEKFHQIIFSAINNLAVLKVEKIDVQAIDSMLSDTRAYKVFNDNGGCQWMAKAVTYCTPENFPYYYNIVKKYTLLRNLKEDMGLDISDIYDENEIDAKKREKQMEKFNAMTIDNIIEHYNSKWMALRNAWNKSYDEVEIFMAGAGIDEHLKRLNEKPRRGFPLYNKVVSEMVGGMRSSKYYLFSAPSGHGKSRYQVANACYLSIPELYNVEKKCWEKNPHKPQKSTYISTELKKDEIQDMMIAFVSGVEEHIIKNKRYTPEEYERIARATELINKSELQCITISDFDISDIENIIVDEVRFRGSGYIFFDYLHQTPKLMSYYSKKAGNQLQGHQVLYLFSNALKNLANKYDVFMFTSTQLNRDAFTKDAHIGANMLSGSIAIVDKCDVAIIIRTPNQKELKLMDSLIKGDFDNEPNMCYTIHKNRGGRYKDVHVWTKTNLGNMREKVLFVTDDKYQQIHVPEDSTTFDL